MKQGKKAKQCTSRHWWIFVISRIQSGSQNLKSTKAELYSEVTSWKMIMIIRSIYWTRIISITNDSRKDHGYHIQIARVGRTSSRRSIRLHPGQNGTCTNVIDNSKVRMSRHLDTSTKAQMAQIMVQYGRPSRSSWAKSVRPPFGRTIMGKVIWESFIEIRLGKSSELRMFIR